MPRFQQLDNPKGAFGYVQQSTAFTTPVQGFSGAVDATFRWDSTFAPKIGGAVGLTTVSNEAANAVIPITSASGSVRLFAGIVMSYSPFLAASPTSGVTNDTVNQAVVVRMKGPVFDIAASTTTVVGTWLIPGASNSDFPGGGPLKAATTAFILSGAGPAFFAVCISSNQVSTNSQYPVTTRGSVWVASPLY